MSKIINRPTQLAAITALVAIASPAAAEFYQFTFGGEITVVDGFVPEPWDDIQVGSEFEVTYVFDSETPDQLPIDWIGWYDVMWAEVTIDGISQFTRESDIVIEDEGLDRYTVRFFDLPIGATGKVGLVGWSVIDSDELLTELNLDDWPTSRQFEFTGIGPNGVYDVNGEVTSFHGHVVPTPGGLVVLAVVGATGWQRRGARTR